MRAASAGAIRTFLHHRYGIGQRVGVSPTAGQGSEAAVSHVSPQYSAQEGRQVPRYFSVVENRRLPASRTLQRTVLYLGEIDDQQRAAWRKTLEVFEDDEQEYRT